MESKGCRIGRVSDSEPRVLEVRINGSAAGCNGRPDGTVKNARGRDAAGSTVNGIQ